MKMLITIFYITTLIYLTIFYLSSTLGKNSTETGSNPHRSSVDFTPP